LQDFLAFFLYRALVNFDFEYAGDDCEFFSLHYLRKLLNLRAMTTKHSDQSIIHSPIRELAINSINLSRQILNYANQGIPRIEFLRKISNMFLKFSGCDAIELRMKYHKIQYRWEAINRSKKPYNYEVTSYTQKESGKAILCFKDDSGLEHLCRYIFLDKPDPSLPFFTRNGSFWTGNLKNELLLPAKPETKKKFFSINLSGNYYSLAMIPFIVDSENNGLLLLKSKKKNYFTIEEIELYEVIAQTLGAAVANRRAQAALRERIKELSCLYNIVIVVDQPEITLKESMESIVNFLPVAFQFPEIAHSRIALDDNSYISPGFREGRNKLISPIIINKIKRGSVEVIYDEKKSTFEKSRFLKEEQNLIDTVARELSLIIERKQTQEEKIKLQDQLRHADRLATIGQLAAGIAHELNEPLGNILGFTQLASKNPELPQQIEQDLKKILSASLYAREIVKKLLLFARQVPPHKTDVNLNQVVENGISFFESRCAKEGIELICSLTPDLPEITADPSQLTQVLINLAINAIQAMPTGGRLTLKTLFNNERVSLIVEDTGTGMSQEVLKQIFIPFFTTKDVDQGTGIGLAVVHGIVSSHGGLISVDSKVYSGTKFEIHLPLKGHKSLEETT